MEKVDNYSDAVELKAIVMDNRHPGFTTIMQGFYEYMKLLDKRQQMEKEQDEYKKYLELKAKFERNWTSMNDMYLCGGFSWVI